MTTIVISDKLAAGIAKLTRRERAVLNAGLAGAPHARIAEMMGLTERSVKALEKAALRKLKAMGL